MALNEDKKEMLREEHTRKINEEKIQLIRAKIEDKNRYGNLLRYMNKQRREQEEEQQMNQRKEQAALKEFQHEQENKLAFEVDNIKRNEIRQLKLRQQLRENTPELRELERKLKGAYVNKELAAQIAQKEIEKINEKIEEKRTHEILQMAKIKEEELKRILAEEDIIKKAQYKQELQEQIILREKSKRYLYEEFLREKKRIDDIIQRIHDEDERDIQEKMCKMKRTREEMWAFEMAQQKWKQRKKEEIEEENRKIQEFLQQKGADVMARMEEKKKREEAKAKLQEDIARKIHEQRAKQKEREDILQELVIEEQNEAQELRWQAEIEKRVRQRLELRQTLDQQVKEKEEKLREESARDAKFKEEILAKLAEDHKLEQMSEQKRRMKMLQLRRDVEDTMNERRQRRAEELELINKIREQEQKELEDRRKIIEEERLAMLKEHVNNVIGYLPKGLLRPDDLPLLGSDLTEAKSVN
ncbi:meiosis-specific nuclear structural protein 1 [Sitophilus oryzae]|uniref:Meiosis-specific nuclear structural protein 1 n=1 Tax=Sitophilus oryzae TaxID=7048 RepID=A0A6J2YBQ7_SITOR|nr:meiosis-specific nuclear structural protein 1 [Sitophilus oryzae]